MNPPRVHLLPIALCLLCATICDLRARRIPNLIIGAAAVSGLILQFWAGGVLSLLCGLGAAVIVIAALFTFWSRGGLGGGDVKLAGAVAITVGLRALPMFALITALAGGVTALLCWLRSSRPVREDIRANLTLAVLRHEIPPTPPAAAAGAGRVSVPYAVAIALGAAAACGWAGSWPLSLLRL